jgi:hypothetical protein
MVWATLFFFFYPGLWKKLTKCELGYFAEAVFVGTGSWSLPLRRIHLCIWSLYLTLPNTFGRYELPVRYIFEALADENKTYQMWARIFCGSPVCRNRFLISTPETNPSLSLSVCRNRASYLKNYMVLVLNYSDSEPDTGTCLSGGYRYRSFWKACSVSDPNPHWIRIRWAPESGSRRGKISPKKKKN